ncbi:MAG: carbohydrate kinase [Candidatus Bathyarchaeota archaeon B23]|nr:MAG: carbohydrate kinase [Candidatus Bathyarchaeota archaeon B23]
MILDDSLTSREMRAVEMNAEYLGISRLQMMENAGRAVAEAVKRRFSADSRILVVCGLGGNGGDGLAAARHLASQGYRVEVILLGDPSWVRVEETRRNWEAVEAMEMSIDLRVVRDSAEIELPEVDVVVDALVGTGVRGALKPPYREMVEAMNASKAFKVAVDVPSGLEADTGRAEGAAVRADLTVTLHKPKRGFERAGRYLGELIVETIGIPPEAELLSGPGDVHLVSKPRPPEAHKGDFGRVLVVGGSETYTGAPALSALAAYAIGVDLVYVAAPEAAANIIAGYSPTLITIKLRGRRLTPRGVEELLPLLDRVDSAVVGPGLGLHERTVEGVWRLLDELEARGIPTLVDADGLKAIAGPKRRFGAPTVLTPHGGEFKILTGREAMGSLEERGRDVEEEARRLGVTMLLKGHVDIISDGRYTRYNRTGNPGMTVGGTGDVLSGIVAAYMALGANPFEAAVAGAFINGYAGDLAYGEKGYHLSPIDLIERIPRVVEEALAGRLREAERPRISRRLRPR